MNPKRLYRDIRSSMDLLRSVRALRQIEQSLDEDSMWKVPSIYEGYGEFSSIRYKQVPDEITYLFSMVQSSSPKYVCEIGTYRGGSFYLWCRAARDDAILISIDLPNGGLDNAFSPVRIQFYKHFAKSKRQNLYFILANSHQQSTADNVTEILGLSRLDFLFIDGDHTYAGVKRDFELYKPLVRPGGMIAFHDILPRQNLPEIEVHRLWAEIKSDFHHREIIAQDEHYSNSVGIGVIWI